MQGATVDGLTFVVPDWYLSIDVDAVLRNQGADPAVIRARRGAAVALAQRALAEGETLLKPAVAYRRVRIDSVRHERVALDGGARLTGPLIARHLASMREAVAIVATVGGGIDQRITELFAADPPYAVALDGLGSAAVEALTIAACGRVNEMAEADGLHSTVPLSPGMVGWQVGEGQWQIFGLVDARRIGVHLTASSQMIPRKSVSMVIGLGPDATELDTPCDYCSLRDTCRYQRLRE